MGGVCEPFGSKLLLPIGEEVVLGRTLRRLTAGTSVSRVVIPTVSSIEEAGPRLVASLSDQVSLSFIQGGETRSESVANALLYLLEEIEREGGAPEQSLVLVHDAARCMVGADLINRCIESAFQHGACTAAVPCTDTIKRVNEEFSVTETVDRNELWAIQTPQVFRMDLLAKAHKLAQERGTHASATDDAGLVEEIATVKVERSTSENFKVTSPEDYSYLQYLVENEDAAEQ
jgi:2-C-methyl-D-erythritol 4-phosphate cytidylyltransferase